jgi:hypothetical protein
MPNQLKYNKFLNKALKTKGNFASAKDNSGNTILEK